MTGRLNWDVDALDWPHRGSSRFVCAAGLRWHVQRSGRGPVMAMIHGAAAATHSWAGLVSRLETSFDLFRFDLPGHAFSDPVRQADMSLPSIAKYVAQLLASEGIEPSCIVGHSAGAGIAARMVLDRLIKPPAVIISLNGALLPFPGLASWLFPAMARVLSASSLPAQIFAWRSSQPGAVKRVLESTGSHLSSDQLALYTRLFSNAGHVQAALDMMSRWDLRELARDLPRLPVPIHLVACSNDLAVPPDQAFEVRDLIAGARVSYERGMGHLAHEEDPERISRLVTTAYRTADRTALQADCAYTPRQSNRWNGSGTS